MLYVYGLSFVHPSVTCLSVSLVCSCSSKTSYLVYNILLGVVFRRTVPVTFYFGFSQWVPIVDPSSIFHLMLKDELILQKLCKSMYVLFHCCSINLVRHILWFSVDS